MATTYTTTTHKKSAASQEATQARRSDAAKTVEDATNALVEEIKAGKTEQLLAWFNYCAQFHQYSPANQWLITEQCAMRNVDASKVASYRKWQELGYQVKRGERALWIWAPRPYTREVENKQTHETEEKQYVGFILVPVFDASQIAQGTNPETGEEYKPLGAFFTPLPTSEEAAALYEAGKVAASATGFTCSEEELRKGFQGYNQGKAIVVNEALDPTSKFCTLVHEFTHGLLHQTTNGLTKQIVECEAEATSYIVAKHFGITNPFSSDYLQMFGKDEKSLTERLGNIRSAAHAIIVKIEQALGAAQESEEERAA